ncbi:MAG: AAA family ATPase [Microthrixaceae bacterium]|nr:ArsA family ATPase [Microthrixaceae bacterium]MCO5311546.1 AAA family ATPase [Microthrixaceae bacterium]
MTAGGPTPQESLERLCADSDVILCCGSGGVGKTTTAAVLAMEAATLGRRAVVVTIDPAKRLADALGLDELTNEPKPIDGPWIGTLAALMLDTESTFNNLIARYAGSAEQAEKILSNRFYRNIAGALSGTQEYMATEKLYELAASGDFDLIVVDTPPSRNALDFLDAPGRIVRFLDHPAYRMMTAPGRGIVKAVNYAAQPILRGLGKAIGGEVIADAIAFFAAFDGMEEGFKERARLVDRLLGEERTEFVLVASPRRDTVIEASFFANKLASMKQAVAAVVVNRMYPTFEPVADDVRTAAEASGDGALRAHLRNLDELDALGRAERLELAPLTMQVEPAPIVEVPLLSTDVHDLDSLALLADHMFGRAD